MNTNILKLAAVLLCLVGSFACQKENVDGEYFQEVAIGSENPVINYTADGISFDFHLLNEQGEPSTRFNEGENFSFYFKMTNNNVFNELEVAGQFSARLVNDGFCNVVSQEQGSIGYPFEKGICLEVYINYPFYGEDNTYDVIIHWNCESWGLFLCVFESLHREYLTKGKYYTQFTHNFEFYSGNGIKTIPISFKINFEIK
jgi:hypothetical protein